MHPTLTISRKRILIVIIYKRHKKALEKKIEFSFCFTSICFKDRSFGVSDLGDSSRKKRPYLDVSSLLQSVELTNINDYRSTFLIFTAGFPVSNM